MAGASNDIDDEEADPLISLLRNHRLQLMEHFCSVQIVATKAERDGSSRYQSGGGCGYARRGAVRAWLIDEETGTQDRQEEDADE